ncbi:MAG: protease inhibitor I42 family protein [Legionella sp.]|nr:protease inhibitor I42 family protein [Legionella sp.]
MKTLIGVTLLLFSLLIHAENNMVMNINTKQSGFVVSLAANPTTGYQWTVMEYDTSLLNLTTSRYVPSNSRLMGAGGKMLFTFKLVRGKSYPVSTNIMFKYARPWEADRGTMKTVTIKFMHFPDEEIDEF